MYVMEEYSLPNNYQTCLYSLPLQHSTENSHLNFTAFPLLLLNAGRPGLNSPISDDHLALIARDYLNNWEALRFHLGLSYAQQTAISKSYPQDYVQQKHECLQEWRRMKGDGATYQTLISAAEEATQQLLADQVKRLIAT